MALRVKDMLKEKGLKVIAIDSNATVDTAVSIMTNKCIRHLPVTDRGDSSAWARCV